MKFYNKYRHKLGLLALAAAMSIQLLGQFASQQLAGAELAASYENLSYNNLVLKAVDTSDPNLAEESSLPEKYSRSVMTDDSSGSGYVNGSATVELVKGIQEVEMDCYDFARQPFADGPFKGKSTRELRELCRKNKDGKDTASKDWVIKYLKGQESEVTRVKIDLDSGLEGLFCSEAQCKQNSFVYVVASQNLDDIKKAVDLALEDAANKRNQQLSCDFEGDGPNVSRKEQSCLEKRYKKLARECRKERRARSHTRVVSDERFNDDDEDTYSACESAKDVYALLEKKLIDQTKENPEAAKLAIEKLLKVTPSCDAEQAREARCKLAEPYVGLQSLLLAADIRSDNKQILEQLSSLRDGDAIGNRGAVIQLRQNATSYDRRLREILTLGNRTSLNEGAIKLASTGTLEPYERIVCFAHYRAMMPIIGQGQCQPSSANDKEDPYDASSAIASILHGTDAQPPSVFNNGQEPARYSSSDLGIIKGNRSENFRGSAELLRYTAFAGGTGLAGSQNPQAGNVNYQNVNFNRQQNLGAPSRSGVELTL